MAIFMDTGGGDIYAGPTKKAILAAMKADSNDYDLSDARRVSAKTKITREDENAEAIDLAGMTTLAKEYHQSLGSYCIASLNC